MARRGGRLQADHVSNYLGQTQKESPWPLQADHVSTYLGQTQPEFPGPPNVWRQRHETLLLQIGPGSFRKFFVIFIAMWERGNTGRMRSCEALQCYKLCKTMIQHRRIFCRRKSEKLK